MVKSRDSWGKHLWPCRTCCSFLGAFTLVSADSICKDQFEAEFQQLRQFSFASLPTYGHLPWMSKDVAETYHGEKHEMRLEFLFADATSKVLMCRTHGRSVNGQSGGRFWFVETAGGIVTVCAPAICSQEEVETQVVPSLLNILQLAPMPALSVRELRHWAELQLDFVIIGVDGCGSTALHRHLSRHTEVVFTNFSIFNVDEDFFLQEMGRQTLPFASQVQRVKDFRAKLRPLKVGLYQPWIWTAPSLLKALSYNEDLKVVLSLCDPVDRFEKRLHALLLQNTSTSSRKIHDLSYHLVTDPFSGPGMARIWQKWLKVFGSRLMVVERTQLSQATTFRQLSNFLQIRRPYPKEARFHPFNARGKGNRSAFCEHMDLVHDLKERFDLEYKWLNSVDSIRTDWIQQRLTRCDRPSQEPGRSCAKARCWNDATSAKKTMQR